MVTILQPGKQPTYMRRNPDFLLCLTAENEDQPDCPNKLELPCIAQCFEGTV